MWEGIQLLILPFVACATILSLLGYLGIHVLKREIIFIDIALAQIAAVGATFAHIYLGTKENSMLAYLCAFGFTVLAAMFFSQIGKRIRQISTESVIGVSYAIAAAAALFILALSAGGDVHMENMLTGSILYAMWQDILAIALLFGFIGLIHFVFRRRFIRISENYREVIGRSEKDVWWDFLFYVLMGMAITFSVKIAGVLVIFSFLIIPATFSALFAETWRKRLFIAWGIGIVAVIFGLAFSIIFDFSCGPSVVTFLGLALVIAALLKWLKHLLKWLKHL